ncbi:MAG TPA: hypothetical protein VHC22_16250 [Pirellulales bacterium]|nr:hypothetical protein [Pirellulales bacterium]
MPKNPELLDLVRGYEFWRDGCAVLISNVCESLRLAEIAIEPRTIIRFVSDIECYIDSVKEPNKRPDCYCDQCFRTAFELTEGKDARKQCEELMRYFLVYLNDRTWVARTMLIDSAVGVVSCFENITPRKKG